VLVIAYEVERVLFRLALAALVCKLLLDAWGAWRARRRTRRTPAVPAAWPLVTVQLPLRDERFVAERAIRAVAALDYPALEIQVLDDSDDDTRDIVDAVVAELRARGIAIEALRRADRSGAKAGALAYGLQSARGEYVAVFDADFMPRRDFLRRAIPYAAADPSVGMVQGRWEYVDRDASWLARTQALVLDGLMLVEQPAQDARGQPLHFNGTAGVWRRACIADVGGWSGMSLTEDVELSYRAARERWSMVHVAELAVPTELPHSMRAYRAQQRRWTRGNAQVLRGTWRAIATAPLPLRHRLAMLLRLASRGLYVFLAILTVAMPLTTFGVMPWLVDYRFAVDAAVLAAIVASLYIYYVPALQIATGSAWRGALLVPAVMALHVGFSPCGAAMFVAGLFGRPAPFVRTPKLGDSRDAAPPARYRLPLDPFAFVEVAVAVAYFAFTVLALQRGLYAFALFFAFWAAAHAWTGVATIASR